MKRILLVDDDVNLLTLFNDVLKGRGYNVVTLKQGSQVMEASMAVNFDLII